jgi:hypothetical protein
MTDHTAPHSGTHADDTHPAKDKAPADAAMSPTGLDIDNDHADDHSGERQADRLQDSTEPGNDLPGNREQDDEDAQAQTVADDAIRGMAGVKADSEDSEHGGDTNPAQIVPDDAQDVVDHMEQMESSGLIDMDAYRGERNDDDESGMLGEGGMEPGDLDEHGNPARGPE